MCSVAESPIGKTIFDRLFNDRLRTVKKSTIGHMQAYRVKAINNSKEMMKHLCSSNSVLRSVASRFNRSDFRKQTNKNLDKDHS